jgi:hypothetical protein
LKKVVCNLCGNKPKKDRIALNKKLLGRNIDKYFCLDCLADFLNCTVDYLLIKIAEFKERGCMLFK